MYVYTHTNNARHDHISTHAHHTHHTHTSHTQDSYLNRVLPSLLKRAGETSGFLAIEAEKAILAMINHCTEHKSLQVNVCECVMCVCVMCVVVGVGIFVILWKHPIITPTFSPTFFVCVCVKRERDRVKRDHRLFTHKLFFSHTQHKMHHTHAHTHTHTHTHTH